MNIPLLRACARPLCGIAIAAAVFGVPATAASAAQIPTAKVPASVHLDNRYCDNASGVNCQSYGYPSDHGSGGHHRHHRY